MRPYSDPILECLFRHTYETEEEGWLLRGYPLERAKALAQERAEYIIKVVEADRIKRQETLHVTHS